MSQEPVARASASTRTVRVVLAAFALLAAACGRAPAAPGGVTPATSIVFSGYAGFHGEAGHHPQAALEARVLALAAPLLAERGLPLLGAGPAGDDELALRVVSQASADAGVRFTAGAGGGEVLALELRGSRGVLWAGVFPADEDDLESRLRDALARLRFEPPAGP
jgi:hypothetical protein